MSKTITINDIAEQLNLSRNTVSKALNGKYVPEKTRIMVIEKARELNYKMMNIESFEIKKNKKYRILLLSGKPLNNINFFIPLVRGIENYCYKMEYEYIQYVYNGNTTSFKILANSINEMNLDGIIAIETFEEDFVQKLINMNIPITFIDFCANKNVISGKFDIVETNNNSSVAQLVDELINKNKIKRFSFVGDITHCLSFKDRYLGMLSALTMNGIHHDTENDIHKTDNFDYGNPQMLQSELSKLKKNPECFVCGNDFIARNIINTLKKLGKNVPDDCFVIGFDNASESFFQSPGITTIGINKEQVGIETVKTLINRIENPDSINKVITLETKIIKRETTK